MQISERFFKPYTLVPALISKEARRVGKVGSKIKVGSKDRVGSKEARGK
jgi:hypothetical protein